jgi:uncharacterized protein (DUF2147 family)
VNSFTTTNRNNYTPILRLLSMHSWVEFAWPDKRRPLYNSRRLWFAGGDVMKTIRWTGVCACVLAGLLYAAGAAGQELSAKLSNAIGHWQVVNSDGTPGGKVETYLENGQLFGRVTEVRPGRTPKDVCDKCSGEFKNQPILGMVNMRSFHAEGDDWVGGTVIDPENGKEYRGKIWTVGADGLRMRGFVGISLLGRTESWVRIR